MSKRTVFTTVTPLPPGISREMVMETLHDHVEMMDLNPLIEEKHLIKPPPHASPEEYHCQWYSLTDKVQYLPGGLMSGKVTYTACFHDLASGLQTHIYAPLGLNIRGKWTLGGSLPGEPVAPVELGVGVPLHGLWLREDVDMRCNFIMTTFVKGNLKRSHAALVERLIEKAQTLIVPQDNYRSERSSPLSEESRSRVEAWAESTLQAAQMPEEDVIASSTDHSHSLTQVHLTPPSNRSSTPGRLTEDHERTTPILPHTEQLPPNQQWRQTENTRAEQSYQRVPSGTYPASTEEWPDQRPDPSGRRQVGNPDRGRVYEMA